MPKYRLIPPITFFAAVILLAGCDREPAAWEAASAANSIGSYEQYLAEHSDGAHAADASAALAAAAWEAASAGNTIQSYEQYLAENPDGAHAADANAALMPLRAAAAWDEARAANNAESYDSFVAAYPEDERAAEARVLSRALELGGIRANLIMRTPPNSFLQSSPSGRLVAFPEGTTLMVDLISALHGEPVMAKLEAEYTRIEDDVAMFETADGQCLGLMLAPNGGGNPAKPCSERVLPDPDDTEAVLVYAWKFVERTAH